MNKRDAREGRDLRETSPQKEHVVDFWIRLDFRAHAAPQETLPQDAQKGRSARPQRVKTRGVPSGVR